MFGKNFSLSYILAILVFVVCTLCFAACSGDPEDASLSSTGSSVSGASSVFAPPDVTELTVNIWADGNLAAGGEQWFRFAAVANTQYIHFSPGVLEGIFLQTYSDSGAAVDDPAFLSGDIPSVTRELSVARIYFIRVWVTTPAANGAYHIAYTA
ncbi:MAG: hypothetical protein LBC99_02740, partial [Spirochaetota bacterium]|nr:hypothetical protein [Spirochaetota bacterium]